MPLLANPSLLWRYLFWVNFSLAIFFGFMILILWVVALLYALNLDAAQTSQREFAGIFWFIGYLSLFVGLTGISAWGATKAKVWVAYSSAAAAFVAIMGIVFLRNLL